MSEKKEEDSFGKLKVQLLRANDYIKELEKALLAKKNKLSCPNCGHNKAESTLKCNKCGAFFNIQGERLEE